MKNKTNEVLNRLEIVAKNKREADLFSTQQPISYNFMYSLKIEGENKKRKYIYSA